MLAIQLAVPSPSIWIREAPSQTGNASVLVEPLRRSAGGAPGIFPAVAMGWYADLVGTQLT
jgi:hypothetical protein